MNLLDRATRFIKTGDESEAEILQKCVDDGGAQALSAVQLLAEDMYGGMTYNIELKAPAASCLLTFGERGLDALVESATRSPTTKNVSLCLSNLASTAAGVAPSLFLRDQSLIAKITQAVQTPLLREAARSRLREYVLNIEDEEDAIGAVGSQLLSASLIPTIGPARELISALAIRHLAISRPVLKQYEELLARAKDDERALQAFFERHPQLLDPMAAAVWAKPNLAGAREPDFLIRRSDDTYLIVEIETPGKLLVTKENQLSAFATHAVAQISDYREFLLQRPQTISAHLPRFSDPEGLVVIGLEGRLSTLESAALDRDNRSRTRLRIVGFDWIARRAEAVARNVIETQITVESIRIK